MGSRLAKRVSISFCRRSSRDRTGASWQLASRSRSR